MGVLVEKKPKVALMESIRSIGYDFNSALADIIDNSISANAKNVQVNLIQSIPAIVIIDDGIGMDKNELSLAMDLGSKNPNDDRAINDLGRFGLGLKSASFSQCKNLTVTSLKNDYINSMTWDLELVQKQQNWIINDNDISEIEMLPYVDQLKKQKHGTIVQWSDFDRMKKANSDLTTSLTEHLRNAYAYLALVFHKFINGSKVKITINGNELEKLDPFLTYRNDTQKIKSDIIRIKNNKGEDCFIEVKPYILPFFKNLTTEDKKKLGGVENIRNRQGFYLYRNNRLITWGSWLHMIGMNELYKNARIEVNIPNNLDDVWEVDVKKSSASIPGVIKAPLFASVKKAIGTSQNVYRKRSENSSEKLGYQVLWNVSEERDYYEVRINKNHPLIAQFMSTLSDEQSEIFEVLMSDLEDNLPKMKIYTNVAESKDEKKCDMDIETRVRQILAGLVGASNEDKVSFLDVMFQSEPYCLHLPLLEKMKEELK